MSALRTIASAFLLGACGANEVVVQGWFPQPVVERLPARLGLHYDEAFRNHELHDRSTSRGESDWIVRTGTAQTRLHDTLLGGMFEQVRHLESQPGQGAVAAGVDAILVPHVDELQYSIPRHTRSNVFEIWIRYRYELYSPRGELLADWTMSCYGKTPTAFLRSAEEAVNLAAVVALRDAGANFVVSFAAVPGVREWLDGLPDARKTAL